MDLLLQIDTFERDPNREHLTALQIDNFYKNLIGKSQSVEGTISEIKRISDSDYEIHIVVRVNFSLTGGKFGHVSVTHTSWNTYFRASEPLINFNIIHELHKGHKVSCEGLFERFIGMGRGGYLTGERKIYFKLKSIQQVDNLHVEEVERTLKENASAQNEIISEQILNSNIKSGAMLLGILGALVGCVGGFLYALGSYDQTVTVGASVLKGGLLFGIIGAIYGAVDGSAKRDY